MEGSEWHTVYLGTGSNLGNRLEYLRNARQLIEERCGRVTAASGIYSGSAWGYESAHVYFNQCLKFETTLNPLKLMSCLQEIEMELGRTRAGEGYADRTIDIDILFYGSEVIAQPALVIPHPRVPERRFVLEPLNEIAPELTDPRTGKPVSELLRRCKDPSVLTRLPGE